MRPVSCPRGSGPRQAHPRLNRLLTILGLLALSAAGNIACSSGGGGGPTATDDLAYDAGATDSAVADAEPTEANEGDAVGSLDTSTEASTDEADGTPTDEGPDPLTTYAPCPYETAVGGLEIALKDGYTAIVGQTHDGVTPAAVPEAITVDGPCALYHPRTLFCDPPCAAGDTCGEDGECMPFPSAIDVGTVTISGLKAEVELTSKAPAWFYTNIGTLPHPAADPGDALSLVASGGSVDAFELLGEGIEPLVVDSPSLSLLEGDEPTLLWTAPSADGPARVKLAVSLANHGGVPAWLECHVDDTGTFTFPQALLDELLGLGFSGWPSVSLTRQTRDSATRTPGCIAFSVTSEVVLSVDIPGLVSCSSTEDCPGGQVCRVDLSCGDP